MVSKKKILIIILCIVFTGLSKFCARAMAGWTKETMVNDLKTGCFYQRGIVVDEGGHPHIVYGGDHLYYTYFDGNAWSPDEVIMTSKVTYITMALDSSDNVHISCYDAGNQELRYVAKADVPGSRQTYMVDTSGDEEKYPSIALDSVGNVYISYYNEDKGDLWFAGKAPTADSFKTETVDNSGNTGLFTSIAVDSDNKIHISYYDAENQDLRYAVGSGSWQKETIDSNGNAGRYSSLALDSNNNVHIGYYDAENQDLRYATNASGSWHTEIVDSGGSVGEYASLAIDSFDKVHISYYDAGNHDLKYAVGTSGSWHTETVDSEGDVGKYASLALDPFHNVYIIYYDVDNLDLKYVTNSVSYYNRPPVLDPIGNKITDEDKSLQFTIRAVDPDGDDITCQVDGLPVGADFDPDTRTFNWTPGYGDAGNHKVTFTVAESEDPTESVSEIVTITVNNKNCPPVLFEIEDESLSEGEELEFTIKAEDSDGDDILTYSCDSVLPDGATLDPHTGTFTWKPGYDYVNNMDSREIKLQFNVSDGEDYDSQPMTITVHNVTVLPNCQPNPPTLIYPDNNECGVSLTPELQMDDFSDPDINDIHTQTQWKIFREDDNLCILDITSISCLTALVVAESVLDEGTSYFWQGRFYDNNSAASDWSDSVSFTTLTNHNDENSNGVPDNQEEYFSVDDMDNDGKPDREQSDIKCVNSGVGGGQIGVSIKPSSAVSSLESLKAIDPATIAGAHRPENMPLGLISFKVKVNNAGDSGQVAVYLFPPAPDGAKWYKYDPMNGWHVYPHASFSADGTCVTLQLKDGDIDYGDVDGTENGIIIDPSGFGISSITDTQDIPEEKTNAVEAKGCFLATVANKHRE